MRKTSQKKRAHFIVEEKSGEVKKIYGAHGIAKYMGMVEDYVDIGILLRVLGVPKVDNPSPTYCLTKEEADSIKRMIENYRNAFQ